jgi:hypothetical protein
MKKIWSTLWRFVFNSDRKKLAFKEYHAGSCKNTQAARQQILTKILGRELGTQTEA